MSLSIAVQAAVVYASAAILARSAPATARRVVWIVAAVAVLGLPLLGWAPRWPAPPGAPEAVLAAVEALQEPPAPALAAAAAEVQVPWGWIVWAVGAGVAAVRLVADLAAVARLRTTAVERRGDVAYSGAVAVPIAVGLLRPLILLPLAARGWTPQRVALVLAHERAHTDGYDNLWLLVARIGACVHWFDPLAWWAVSALRDACEHRADDVTLAGGADPAEYARTLVDVARRAPAASLAMARPSRLEQRIRTVLGERRPAGRLGAARAAAVGIVALAAATAPGSTAAVPADLAAHLEAEADRLMAAHQPEGVVLLVLDARTGEVLGRAERGGITTRPMPVGSVLKPFVVAAALQAGVPEAGPFPDGDMAAILERSSNPGAVAVAARAGRPAVEDLYRRVGLPAPASVDLDGLALGQAPVAPLEVARAWTHLAGGGAIPDAIAARTRELLVGAVEGEHATGGRAAVPGVRVAGKTGTAPLGDGNHLASFVGLVPAEAPELVVLVAVAAPSGEEAWGGVVAAPAFRRIVEGL